MVFDKTGHDSVVTVDVAKRLRQPKVEKASVRGQRAPGLCQ